MFFGNMESISRKERGSVAIRTNSFPPVVLLQNRNKPPARHPSTHPPPKQDTVLSMPEGVPWKSTSPSYASAFTASKSYHSSPHNSPTKEKGSRTPCNTFR